MNTRGLTVLELLVVVALLGIVGAMATPNIGAWRAQWRLAAAARQVVMDLKVARTRAIADVGGHRVRFAVAGANYQHQVQTSGGLYVDEGVAVSLPDGIMILACTASGAAIGFRPRGNAGTFGTITLRNESGMVRRIVIDLVGRMRIE